VVSFDVVWSGPITRRVSVLDGTLGNHYAGEYVENQVTVTWSGTNLATGFTFTSNPGTLATSVVDGGFAELGQERNGSFNPSGAAPAPPGGPLAQDPGDRAAPTDSAPDAGSQGFAPVDTGLLGPLARALGVTDSQPVRAVVAARLEPVRAGKPQSALLPAGDDGAPALLFQQTPLASAGATHSGLSDLVFADLGGSPLDNTLRNDLAMRTD
jgi:hypothetical protein